MNTRQSGTTLSVFRAVARKRRTRGALLFTGRDTAPSGFTNNRFGVIHGGSLFVPLDERSVAVRAGQRMVHARAAKLVGEHPAQPLN